MSVIAMFVRRDKTDADRFLENLRKRLAQFGLELHPDKTRRIEFGRFAEENRRRRGEGKPETFDFLGLTHISGKNSLGRFAVRRKTIRKRIRAKLGRIKPELRKRMHDPLSKTGQWLKSIVQGHFNSRGLECLIWQRAGYLHRKCSTPIPRPVLPLPIRDKNRMR